MTLTLKPLPYAYDALEPLMSAETVKTHHGKHQAKYVKTVNELIDGTRYADMTLDELVQAAKDDGDEKLFNNAAQVWNHEFYWSSMTPETAKPSRALAAAIKASFGSEAAMSEAFRAAGEGHVGSGWVWLVASANGGLAIEDTHDAETPIVAGRTPILVCDVWEHAYYLDTKNDRKAFLTGFLKKLANWQQASTLFAGVQPAASDAA